jgi:molybdopterin/thiamine biosynthesis adenylyltransferase
MRSLGRKGELMNVTIVGVGALGSHLIQFIRNEDISLSVIDFDRVEMRNVASQFHTKNNVGKKKVDSMKMAMQFFFARKIQVNHNKLTGDNKDQLLGSAGLVIDCLDNGDGRRVIQDYVRGAGIPCIHGALAANGEYGQVIWDENFVIDDEPGEGVATCEDGEHLPFIGMTAVMLARAAQAFLRSGSKMGFSIHPTGVMRL